MIRTLQSSFGMPALIRVLQALPESEYPLEIRWGRPRRTNRQNAFLWLCYSIFADGLTERTGKLVKPDWIHELCRQHFLPRVEVPGLSETIPMSTTELCRSGNDESFWDYILQIQELAARSGVVIPDPDPEMRSR